MTASGQYRYTATTLWVHNGVKRHNDAAILTRLLIRCKPETHPGVSAHAIVDGAWVKSRVRGVVGPLSGTLFVL